MAITLAALVVWLGACLVVEWRGAEARASSRVDKARTVGDRNLAQAERMLRGCLRDGVMIIGRAVYLCEARDAGMDAGQL